MPHPALVATLALFAALLAATPRSAEPIELPTQTQPVHLVELYTSQGCHSCPPADRLLTTLEQDAQRDSRPLRFLAFHVDYWNRLGWTDPFSDPAYSDRQRRYGHAFRNRSIYTPQLIVHGDNEFVGSDRSTATRALANLPALDPQDQTAITLHHATRDGHTLHLQVDLSNPPPNARLYAAVTDGPHDTAVPRGENRGKTLRESSIVRALTSTPAADQSALTLALPEDLDAASAQLTVWLQDPATMRIHAAVAVDTQLGH